MDKHIARSKLFTDEVGLPLFVVRTNIPQTFPEGHAHSHTFRNCGVVLLFQKMFCEYYYSSGYTFSDFEIKCHNFDPAHYDILSLAMISTDNVSFYSSGATYSRLEKTALLTGDPLAWRHLYICTVSERNCGECAKCARTLLSLDALGELDKFREVFDLDKYRRRRAMQIGFAISEKKSKKDFFYKEICKELKRSKKIPLFSYAWAVLFLLSNPIRKKIEGLDREQKERLLRFAIKYHVRVPW